MEEKDELFEDIKSLVEIDGEIDEKGLKTLEVLYRQAKRNVISHRFPFGYTDIEKEVCLLQHQNTVLNAVIYSWNKQGAEGQTYHMENGITRQYIDDEKLYDVIVPKVKTL